MKDLIELARESGASTSSDGVDYVAVRFTPKHLTAFAEAIRAEQAQRIAELEAAIAASAQIDTKGDCHSDEAVLSRELYERMEEVRAQDAARWQWARKNLLSATFQSGKHNSGQTSIQPFNEANTDWYWDRVADDFRTAIKEPKP